MESARETKGKTRVLLVDDHEVFLWGLAAMVGGEPDMEVCGRARSVREAMELVEETGPDLVVSDLTMRDRSGLELLKDLKARHRRLPVLVVSLHDELIYAQRVLKAGGRGYLMKECSEELLPAIREVLGGNVYVSREVMNQFMTSLVKGSEAHYSFPLSRLTDRELEVFDLIGKGQSTVDIAKRLGMSDRTADAHRTHIRQKLGLPDSNALLRYAVRWVESGKLV